LVDVDYVGYDDCDVPHNNIQVVVFMKKMKHKHYDDIVGNIVYGWSCYKCDERLSWFKVFRLGIEGFYG